MTRKVKDASDWTATLSDLPSDELTFSTGSNFGLDGFQFDTPYEQGGEDAHLPQTKGFSELPDGYISFDTGKVINLEDVAENKDGVYLDENVAGAKEAALVDLEWLDPTQDQDPERLPDNPTTLDSKSQLEEAWGTNRRTDGTRLVPNKDLDAVQYEQSIQEGSHSGLPPEKMAEARELGRSAVRQAHFGKSMDQIRDILAVYPHHLKGVWAKIQDETGLMGNVYVQAAAFPGIKNGKWAKELRRSCRTARYVITDDEAVATKLGMEMVSEVPWKRAMECYRPTFDAVGVKIASGDPREALRRAFMTDATPSPTPSFKPVVKPTVAPRKEVLEALQAEVFQDAIKTSEEQARESKRRKALVQIAKWVKNGRLSQVDALRLHDVDATPEEMLSSAAKLMTATYNTPVYDGVGANLPDAAREARMKVWATLETQEAELESARMAKAKRSLMKAVKAGQLTKREAGRILRMGKSAAGTEKILAAAVRVAAERRVAQVKTPKTKEYQGTVQRAVAGSVTKAPKLGAEERRILKAASVSGIKAQEFRALVRWARQKMTEGSVGQQLDQLLSAHFSPPLLKAASSTIKDLRAKHEGLAGHLYVDAAAYNTKGISGCKTGAAIHRANGNISFVLPMAKCASCTKRNDMGVCSVYNKKLISCLPKNAKKIQRETIAGANTPEEANLGNSYDRTEFGLSSIVADGFDLNDAPSSEQLGDVSFGAPLEWE